MEEVFDHVNIVTTEAQVSLSTHLKHLALTMHFSRPEKEIKLKFVKVQGTPPSKKSTVELSFQRTRTKLLTVLKAIWKDENKRDGAPRKKLPDHLQSIIEFGTKGTQLIELLLAATVMVDRCLEFTAKAMTNDRTLSEFVRDLFQGVSSFMNTWRLLEHLLRVKVWKDKATLDKIKNNPTNGENILTGTVCSLCPEKVRDWAVTTIHDHRKRRGDLFFSGLVTEKDASAWAFQIIGHLHSEPDLTANLSLEGVDVASEDHMWNVIRHLNQD
jgi:hypothetical protein